MDQADPHDKIPDNLKCPICMEIPTKEVYQCKEGHHLCHECYSRLTKCPICRVPFRNQRIRPRAIEEMLDKITWDCPYKESGCNTKINRQCLDHAQSCGYKNCPTQCVCKAIGFKNCSFKMNRARPNDAISHLQSVHGAVIFDSSSLEMECTGYSQFCGGSKMIILRQGEVGYAMILLLIHQLSGLRLIAFYLRYPHPGDSNDLDGTVAPFPYKLEYSLRSPQSLLSTNTFAPATPVDIIAYAMPHQNIKLEPKYISDKQISNHLNGNSQSFFILVKVKKANGMFLMGSVNEPKPATLALTSHQMEKDANNLDTISLLC